MKVKILSKLMFEECIVPKLKDKWGDNCFFISILDPDNSENYFPDSDNYKTVWFYDLEYELGDYKIFNNNIAKELIEFILKNKNKSNCIVHCTAGVARSGAVGKFINNILGEENKKRFRKSNPHISPNRLVLKLLNKNYTIRTQNDENYWQFNMDTVEYSKKDILWKIYCEDYIKKLYLKMTFLLLSIKEMLKKWICFFGINIKSILKNLKKKQKHGYRK